MQATARIPTQANGLPYVDEFGGSPQRGHFADRFVAGYKRVLAPMPFVLPHRNIRVAYPTVLDLDFNLFVPEWSQIVGKRFQFGAGGRRGKSMDLSHAD
jgi:hypothetical protein